jgi:glycosyltransferase involved in cell wall biosynthesis
VRVLIIHNSYRQPGGEDAAVRSEAAMLESAGHVVIGYFRSNDEIRLETLTEKADLTVRTMWSLEAYRAIRNLLRRERPDVAHCHNLFPLISTSAYSACRDEGIPVVQTLHNFRLLCSGATLFRNGRPCEECLRMKSMLPGVVHGCYHQSRAATALVASMVGFHRSIGTWEDNVDVYIALSEFARRKFEEGGLPGSKIEVKCNLTELDAKSRVAGDFGVFAGRLAAEKGISTLLKAWKAADVRHPLRIIGDGPLRRDLESEREMLGLSRVCFEGQAEHDCALEAIRSSRFFIFPSECYENCPMGIIEAFACGVPVIASKLGATQEMVEDGRTGRLFEAGNAEQLAEILKWAFANPERVEWMGRNAREEFERKYEPARNRETLERIYVRAMEQRKRPNLSQGGVNWTQPVKIVN